MPASGPRNLITGASGVVGNALKEHLESLGEDVAAVLGRADCDLENPSEARALFRYFKPNRVYHIAGAVFGVGGNMAFPGDAFRRNVLINTNVVQMAQEFGASKIVAMGSAAMYADGLVQPMREADALSGEPHGSEFAYAFAKRALLVQLKSYRQQFGIDYAFAIATNMYGPHDRFNADYGHVIPSLLIKFRKARETGGTVNVWGDGSPTRDFLYSDDAAHGLHLMMQRGSGAYNLASGNVRSIRDLVDAIGALFPDVKYEWDITKPLGQLKRSYDIAQMTALGFQADVSLEEGLARTARWLDENPAAIRD